MTKLFNSIREDIRTVLERDPAARSYLEVMLCYSGLHAVWAHHVNHRLWLRGWRLIARLASQYVRFCTGVEIHPGAEIGRRVFIDHAMGVTIGETTIIGNDVTIFQGVTLGGTGKEKGKRHPTIGDNVTIGAGAKVLGNIVIGRNSRLGAGSVVLRDVPENSTVVGVPGQILYKNGKRLVVADPKEITNPVAEAITQLAARVERLELQSLNATRETQRKPLAADFAFNSRSREAR